MLLLNVRGWLAALLVLGLGLGARLPAVASAASPAFIQYTLVRDLDAAER
jgi:hypothetical protein